MEPSYEVMFLVAGGATIALGPPRHGRLSGASRARPSRTAASCCADRYWLYYALTFLSGAPPADLHGLRRVPPRRALRLRGERARPAPVRHLRGETSSPPRCSAARSGSSASAPPSLAENVVLVRRLPRLRLHRIGAWSRARCFRARRGVLHAHHRAEDLFSRRSATPPTSPPPHRSPSPSTTSPRWRCPSPSA